MVKGDKMKELADVAHFDEFLFQFRSVFTKPQYNNFVQYAKGILSARNKNISSIALTCNYTKNQSTLNRFLTESPWSVDALNFVKCKIIKSLIDINKPCFVSIDDTLISKTGEKIEFASHHFDHCEQDYIFGHCLVTSHIVNGSFQTPLAFKHYLAKSVCKTEVFKTKVDLAIEIINECKSLGIGDYFLFDSWYFASEIAERIHEMRKNYIAMCKNNRKIIFEEKWLHVRDLPDKLPAKQIGKYECKELICEMKGLNHLVRIVCTRKDKEWKFIVTDDIDSPLEFIIESYAKRWSIEVLHKDLKNSLGIKDCQMRKRYGFIRYWALIFLVCLILQAMKAKSKAVKTEGTIGKIVKYLKNLFHLDWILKKIEDGAHFTKKKIRVLMVSVFMKNAKV